MDLFSFLGVMDSLRDEKLSQGFIGEGDFVDLFPLILEVQNIEIPIVFLRYRNLNKFRYRGLGGVRGK